MVRARGDGYESRVGRGDIELTVAIVSPRHNGPVGLETQAMGVNVVPARGYGDEIGIGRGDVGLTVLVVSPPHDGAVGFEAQAVHPSSGDGHEPAGKINADDLVAPPDD